MSSLHRTTPFVYLGILLVASATFAYPTHHDLDSSRRHMKSIEKTFRRAKVLDAKRQLFASRYWARTDVRSLAGLDAALAADSPDEMRSLAATFIEDAAREGRASFESELARLPMESVYSLARSLDCDEDPLRECILDHYRNDAEVILGADLAMLAEADLSGTISWLATLRESVRPSIKTRGRTRRRALTFPAFPFVYAWRKKHTAREYEGPQPTDFANYRVYSPDRGLQGDAELDLLARYAPVLVQETNPAATYPEEDDRIGSLGFDPSTDRLLPKVDTARPVSYSYVQQLPMGDLELTQLAYTYWYPEHPKLKRIDAGAGKIEGITLRITLGTSGRPLFYETIYNCGCSHRLFVDSDLEHQAAAEFGEPEGDRPFSIQRDLDKRIDLVVPEIIEYVPDSPLVFFVRAGFHQPAAVRWGVLQGIDPAATETYGLRPYDELERLPYGDRHASIFNEHGLVRGASRRLEEIMLTPLGIYKAGHPRQRGTQLIHFDQADFDDPRLFETYLRLPTSFYGERRRDVGGSSLTSR